MTVLSVNLNKIALVRNSRDGHRPSVVGAARVALEAGASGITVHPRPDQRHIRPQDVWDLVSMLSGTTGIEFNIEGNAKAGPRDNGYPGFDALVERALPHQVTLVPDGDNQLTSDHGFDLRANDDVLRQKISYYKSLGCRVSLFMDPDIDQIDRVTDYGANRVELYTGPFADLAHNHGLQDERTLKSLAQYQDAARYATQLGLGVNAGHDLDLNNLTLFAGITEVSEVSIGHALICDALDMGFRQAVEAYVKALDVA